MLFNQFILSMSDFINPPQSSGASGPSGRIFEGGLKENWKKRVHNGSENKKKYGVAEKSVKKCHELEPNGIVHNSG